MPASSSSSLQSAARRSADANDASQRISEPLYQVKLLAALRSGDPALIHPFLAEISKEKRKSNSTSASDGVSSGIDTGAAALHLAIRCASVETVSLLPSHRAISVNGIHPLGSGTTPLHLAASLGRTDIVNLLLDQDNVDDTIRDSNGQTCRDVAVSYASSSSARPSGATGTTTAKNYKAVIKSIDDSRTFLNASFRSLLRTYILSPATPASSSSPAYQQLVKLLENPRIKYVNLSYIDDDTGTSLLHEAAKRKDLDLIELAVKAGADVFTRDRKGRTAYEGTGTGTSKGKGDDRARAFLRQLANRDSTLIQSPGSTSTSELDGPPTLKGYLNKYTNVAKGYSTRWFVLQHGTLSYFRRQEDESIASRGSISMRAASIKPSSSTPSSPNPNAPNNNYGSVSASTGSSLRFEIHPAHGSGNAQKWYLRANHPVEAARWTQAIMASIEWCKRQDSAQFPGARPSDLQRASSKSSSHSPSLGDLSAGARGSVSSFTSASGAETPGGTRRLKKISILARGISAAGGQHHKGAMSSSSTSMLSTHSHSHSRGGNASEAESLSNVRGDESETRISPSLGPTEEDEHEGQKADQGDDEGGDSDADDDSGDNEGGFGERASAHAPHADSFELQSNSVTAQLDLLAQLLSSASTSSPTPSQSPSYSDLLPALSSTHSLMSTYVSMVSDREAWYTRHLRRERERRKEWERSLEVVVKEGEMLESELRVRSRRRGSRFFDLPPSAGGTIEGDGTLKGRRPSALGVFEQGGGSYFSGRRIPSASVVSPVPEGEEVTTPTATRSPPNAASLATALFAAESLPTAKPPLLPMGSERTVTQAPTGDDEVEEYVDTDEEDEFFDAIESNTLPNLVVPPELVSPTHIPNMTALQQQMRKDSTLTITPSSSTPTTRDSSTPLPTMPFLQAYSHQRSRLAIDNDSRPSIGLWSVLKHNIGKDLTKISFPVSFNEPTSMLQRMAEDMEFSECLDVAAREEDQFKRLAFVAAFAMSNYSSTIGRIAKPFNPMLSETFEYCRLDKEYRYVSEQVSHHPPISACWAESPLWRYFGEVDAQNKFMGKSFEIRPTGVAHVELVLPSELGGPDYPKLKHPAEQKLFGEEKVLEHYTWKKVTTNVSGFILGSPTIDHYGDMVITNHRTQDQCVLTFKPRGWRGRDAFEISGHVRDANGRLKYDIAGRWNSQLVARAVTGDGRALHPDISLSNGSLASPSLPEHILLWRNSEKPIAPFNLTPFAITLNDCPKDTLQPYLPPTDCRLRRDQRAFEMGQYELANVLKIKQEEKQRAIRRAREEGSMHPHKPRWFRAETDYDTGERVWAPNRAGADAGEGGGMLEYWAERERIWSEVREGKGQSGHWKDVDEIFIEDQVDF